MQARRLTAVGLVAAAALWIASGHLLPHEKAQSRAAMRAGDSEAKPLFRVAVVGTSVLPHRRHLTIAGRTEADKRVTMTARTGGVVTELRVKRGMLVKKGETIAVLSDEAREAQVVQAQALATQNRTELEAKRQLILNGTLPRLQLVDLEAQLKSAEAALAAAEAERDRGVVRAPWSGIVHDVAVEVGQAAFSFAGREIATLVALDPMLAVVEVAERKLAGIRLNDTAEVSLPLAPVPATRISRSALTFSATGELGVRAVAADESVEFVPVAVIEDEQAFMWVAGIADGSRVIVQGQDFVREGQKVEAVLAPELTATAR